MKANGSSGDSGRLGTELIAAARVRSKGPDFSTSFLALQDAVRRACAPRTEWQAKIAAGIQAALEFAAADPAAAWALTVQARSGESGEADCKDEVLSYFTELLGEVTPAEKRFAVSTDKGVVDSFEAIVRGHLLAGTEKHLPELTPDLLYVALLPYTGLAGAQRWAESSTRSQAWR